MSELFRSTLLIDCVTFAREKGGIYEKNPLVFAILLGAALGYAHVVNAHAAPNQAQMVWQIARIFPAIGLVLAIGIWENKTVRELGLLFFIADFLLSFLIPYAK